jgi:ribonucleoside-diphosphate reductase alpha chain
MQAAAQPWVDSSISKTINVPADIDFESFKDVYTQAYATGCKGCTTYRPNAVTGSVLSVTEPEPQKFDTFGDALKHHLAMSSNTAAAVARASGVSHDVLKKLMSGHSRSTSAENALRIANAFGMDLDEFMLKANQPDVVSRDGAEPLQPHGDVIYMSEPLDRPAALEGHTYKVKWPDSEHALYITINDIVLAGHRRPFEVFINSKNMEHFAWTVALTRMISAVFRRGGDVSFVVEELKAVFDPRGGAWMNGKYVPSILAAIGGVIERHMISIGFIAGEGMGLKSDPQAEVVNLGHKPGPACSSCGQYDMRMAEGCLTCNSCGYSKCG